MVRAFVSKKDFGDLPRRYFYSGPMFRYERPQKGRLRQFHQVHHCSLSSDPPIMNMLQRLSVSVSVCVCP